MSALIEDINHEEIYETRSQHSNTSSNSDDDINDSSAPHLDSLLIDNPTDEERDDNDTQEVPKVVSEPSTETNDGSTVIHTDEAVTVQTRSTRGTAKSRTNSILNLPTADQTKTPEGFGVVSVPKRSSRLEKKKMKQ